MPYVEIHSGPTQITDADWRTNRAHRAYVSQLPTNSNEPARNEVRLRERAGTLRRKRIVPSAGRAHDYFKVGRSIGSYSAKHYAIIFASNSPPDNQIKGTAKPISDPFDDLLNESLPIEERVSSLRRAVASRDVRVVGYAIEVLQSSSADRVWQNHIACAAEWLRPCDEHLKGAMRASVLSHALRIMDAQDELSQWARLACVRRYASLTAPSAVNEMINFLTLESQIDVRDLVAFRVRKILKSAPNQSSSAEPLRTRLRDIATRFLDREVLVSDENTSLALNSTLACAALGDPSWRELVERAKNTDKGALLIVMLQELRIMLNEWSRDPANNANSVVAFIRESVHALF